MHLELWKSLVNFANVRIKRTEFSLIEKKFFGTRMRGSRCIRSKQQNEIETDHMYADSGRCSHDRYRPKHK